MTLRLRLALTLLAVVSGISPALAQPATAQPTAVVDEMAEFEKELDALFTKGGLTADQAAVRASKVSPAVRRSAAEIEVAIALAESAELARIPQVGATATYSRLSPIQNPDLMGFSFPVVLNNYLIQARSTINLSDYVLRYPKLIAAARLAEETARISNRSSEVDAGQEARLAYYEWIRSKLQNLIAKRQLAQVRTTLRQVRALAEVQRLSRADLMRVESNEAVAEQDFIQLQNLADLREEQVRILIDAAPEEALSVGEDIRLDITAPGAAKLDELLGTARKQRLDFKVLDTGIQAKEMQREAEHASRYPKFSAFGQVDYANPNQRVFPLQEKFKLTWVLGVQISWTLNETLQAKTTDRRLRGETNELRADRDNLTRGARLQLLSAQQAVAIAQAALATSSKGLAASEEGYRVRRELLNAQRATAVELVDAETDLTRARIAALNARVDLRVAMVQLTHALGNDVK